MKNMGLTLDVREDEILKNLGNVKIKFKLDIKNHKRIGLKKGKNLKEIMMGMEKMEKGEKR